MINLDKSLWTTVKLSDVVTKKEENDKQEARSRFDRFLKVEHLDAESLQVKRWASQEGGDELPPTFYKIFRKGQILFPTRNPHLKRTALASFDGICGEKTLTIEPNNDLVTTDLLSFLFHSDKFYQHTTQAIIGSTNPHVRWRDVANFEFQLPTKAVENEIVDVLNSIESSLHADKQLLENLQVSYEVFVRSFFNFNYYLETEKLKKNWSIVKAKGMCELIKDGTHGTHKNVESGVNLLSAKDLVDGEINIQGQPRIISLSDYDKIHKNYKLQNNDLLVTVVGTIGNVAIIKDYDDSYTFQRSVGILRFIKNINADYMYFYMRSIFFQKELERKTIKSVQSGIYLEELGNSRFIMPDEDSINAFINTSQEFFQATDNLKTKIESSIELKKSLINKVF
jgi:restriction endonuclease S subunit